MSDSSLQMMIAEKANAMKKQDYFAVLGLSNTAEGADVQKAYFTLAKTFHPDKLAKEGLAEEDLQTARRVFEFMTHAFNVLSDSQKREALKKGEAVQNPGESKLMPKGDEARIFLHQGLKMMRMRAWAKAEGFFRKAVHKDPKNVEILYNLGWAIFNNTEKKESARVEEARQFWEQAVKAQPSDAQANYYLSLYYKHVGRTDQQRIYVQKALDADHKFVEAQREMRLLEMRKGKEKGGSLLAKIFPSLVKK